MDRGVGRSGSRALVVSAGVLLFALAAAGSPALSGRAAPASGASGEFAPVAASAASLPGDAADLLAAGAGAVAGPAGAAARAAGLAGGSADQEAEGRAAEGTGSQAAHEEGGGAPAEGEGPDIPHVFLVLIAILLSAKLLGEGAERIGQPAVLGELLAGVVLGPSLLAVVPPPGSGEPIAEIVHVLAEVGVAILLFEIGLETDLGEMFRVGGSAASVALVGVLLPAGLGFLYWYTVDPQISAHPTDVEFWIVAIFIGATLTATSVGITARVLTDLDQMHTSEARIIIGAAVIDDVLGIVILAVVASLAAGAAVSLLGIAEIFLLAFGFLIAAVVVGNWAAPYLFDLVDRMRVRGVLLVTAFCFALLVASLADLAGSAMIIGAFAAGIVLSSTNQFDTVVERIEPVADIFTPIFFVWVGVPVNVALFVPGSEDFSVAVLSVGGILTAIAVVSKVVAGYTVWKPDVSSIAVGVGMVPRGEVGLIFASIGLSTGVLSSEVYSAVLIMVMLSTFLVPPLLKVIFQRLTARRAEEAAAEQLSGAEG